MHPAWCCSAGHVDDEPNEQAVHRSESYGLTLVEPPDRDDIEIAVAVERWGRSDGADESDETTTVAVSVRGDMLDLHPIEAPRLARLLRAGADIVDGSAVAW